MTMIINNNNNNAGGLVGPFGDTTLTKVFVGGLAWETPKEAMRDHFEKYGDILEAVIISDKTTGRSKGYGFVTFKEPEAAKKACEDPTPVINGRRANCNLASLGARRQRSLTVVPPPLSQQQQTGPNVIVGPRSAGTITPPPSHVQWYYPPTPPPASPYHHHQAAVPYYGYAPATYVATTDVSYNHKLGYTGGAYMNGGHYSHVYPSHATVGAHTLMPMYPMYQYHHQSQAMGLPAQFFCAPTSAGRIAAVPALLSKPTQITPTAVCLAVE